MIIAVDFDDTIVSQAGRSYDDVTTPLAFLDGALAGLRALRRAGHVLLLFSGRANRALRVDPGLDPLVRAGVRRVNRARWEKQRVVNEARYQQMLAFVDASLPGLFAAVDDGQQGKPSADLFIDNRALRLGHGVLSVSWRAVAYMYGEPSYEEDSDAEIHSAARSPGGRGVRLLV